MIAGLGDGAFGIVDDDLVWHSAEELKRPAMTSQPSRHFLVGDELGVAFEHIKSLDLGKFSAFRNQLEKGRKFFVSQFLVDGLTRKF